VFFDNAYHYICRKNIREIIRYNRIAYGDASVFWDIYECHNLRIIALPCERPEVIIAFKFGIDTYVAVQQRHHYAIVLRSLQHNTRNTAIADNTGISPNTMSATSIERDSVVWSVGRIADYFRADVIIAFLAERIFYNLGLDMMVIKGIGLAIEVVVIGINETVIDSAEFEVTFYVIIFFSKKTRNDIGGINIHSIMKVIIIDH